MKKFSNKTMKKIKIIIILILLGGLSWYLFIKPEDYIVRFTAKTSPGAIFTEVEKWNSIHQKTDTFSFKIRSKKTFSAIDETIIKNGEPYDFNWKFTSINDSITKVVVGITQKNKSISNRLKIPFLNTNIEKMAIATVRDFKNGIDNQLKYKYKVAVAGIDTIPKRTYAYLEFKNIKIDKKAEQMMKYNNRLLQIINKYEIKKGKHPFLVIKKWDLDANTIDFRFCFPVKNLDSTKLYKDIKFDELAPKRALKAIYNGNYMTSDKGWFALYEYAKRHAIDIEYTPVEIFYDNPFYGGDELTWKTAVFMPLK